ncbi:MAG: hypothetical protein ACREOV_12940 [Candidatus Dormibacteraceae bacterium]
MSYPPPGAPAPPSSRRWLWWVFGGCGGAVLAVVVVIVVLVVVIVHNANPTGRCLPGDFPIESGMTQVTSIKLAGSCTEIFHTQHGTTQVERYYRTALNENGWHVISQHGGVIQFERRGSGRNAGEVQVMSAGSLRQVTIAYAGR